MHGLTNNSLPQVYQWFVSGLVGPACKHEKQAISNELFKHYFGFSKEDRIINPDIRISESDILLLYKAQKRLNKHEPVQYITGVTDFLSLSINVEKGVLIPRSETEELVLWVADHRKGYVSNRPVRILDVGTGSGCIAVALASLCPPSEVLACDISKIALDLAQRNAATNGQQIKLFFHDILSQTIPKGLVNSLDYLVSNPPYVRYSEKALMQKNVLEYEPEEALFVPDKNPLLYYHAIAGRAMEWLLPGGWLFLEINESMGEESSKILTKTGFDQITVRNDIHGKNRFVRGQKPGSVKSV